MATRTGGFAPMSVWLGVDTSSDVCVGLARGGEILGGSLLADRRAHAEQLMPMIVSLTEEHGIALADVTGIAVGVGPGPFTGLRVGVATAQIIAAVTGAALRGVCSLDVVAAQWVATGAPDRFVSASDARRREVYWAIYSGDGQRVDGPHVSAPEAVPDLPGAGPGAALLPQGVAAGAPVVLDAAVLAADGPRLPDAGLSPLYLRNPDAQVPTTRKSTLLQPRLGLGRAR